MPDLFFKQGAPSRHHVPCCPFVNNIQCKVAPIHNCSHAIPAPSAPVPILVLHPPCLSANSSANTQLQPRFTSNNHTDNSAHCGRDAHASATHTDGPTRMRRDYRSIAKEPGKDRVAARMQPSYLQPAHTRFHLMCQHQYRPGCAVPHCSDPPSAAAQPIQAYPSQQHPLVSVSRAGAFALSTTVWTWNTLYGSNTPKKHALPKRVIGCLVPPNHALSHATRTVAR